MLGTELKDRLGIRYFKSRMELQRGDVKITTSTTPLKLVSIELFADNTFI